MATGSELYTFKNIQLMDRGGMVPANSAYTKYGNMPGTPI